MKLLLSFFTALLALLVFHNNANAQAPAADSIITAVIRVGNLHCNNDMPTIKKRLLNQEGIDEVAFTEREGESSTFTVTYHSSATNIPAIEKTVESTPGCDDPDDKPYRVIKERPRKKKKG